MTRPRRSPAPSPRSSSFFDLVFVFTVTQLTAALGQDHGWGGVGRVVAAARCSCGGCTAGTRGSPTRPRPSRRSGGRSSWWGWSATSRWRWPSRTRSRPTGWSSPSATCIVVAVHTAMYLTQAERVTPGMVVQLGVGNGIAAVLVLVGAVVGGSALVILWAVALRGRDGAAAAGRANPPVPQRLRAGVHAAAGSLRGAPRADAAHRPRRVRAAPSGSAWAAVETAIGVAQVVLRGGQPRAGGAAVLGLLRHPRGRVRPSTPWTGSLPSGSRRSRSGRSATRSSSSCSGSCLRLPASTTPSSTPRLRSTSGMPRCWPSASAPPGWGSARSRCAPSGAPGRRGSAWLGGVALVAATWLGSGVGLRRARCTRSPDRWRSWPSSSGSRPSAPQGRRRGASSA